MLSAVDETAAAHDEMGAIMQMGAADLINIKLMKTGGLYQASRICDLADQYEVKCMMGCMLESAVSVSAGAHLAAARAAIAFCDLDGPSLCAENPYTGGARYEGPKIWLPETPGIGITAMPVEFRPAAG